MIKDFLEIFKYGELIKNLVGRDLKVRYKKSVLGYAWTWLDPLLTMFVFVLVFDIILAIKVEHFPVYLLSGLIPWIFFSTSVSRSLGAITGNAGLIRRIYHPREIFPLTITLGNLINLFLGLLVLIPVILIYGLPITPKILLLPIPIFFLFLFSFGLGLVFSCLNVFFRDMAYIIPFVVRLWFYLTPIFYVIEGRIPAEYLSIYMTLNPLAVILTIFRACLMGNAYPAPSFVLICFATSMLVFVAGYYIFKKNEDLMVKRI